MRAQREVGLDPVLDRRQAELLEPADLDVCERVVREIREGRAAPQRERRTQLRRGPGGVAARHRLPRLAQEPLETRGVELVGIDPELVAARPGEQDGHVRRVSRLEQTAELRDAVPDHLRCGRRRVPAPEAGDDALERQRLVRVQEQQSKQRPLPCAGELERPARLADLEGAEDPELEFSVGVRSRVSAARRYHDGRRNRPGRAAVRTEGHVADLGRADCRRAGARRARRRLGAGGRRRASSFCPASAPVDAAGAARRRLPRVARLLEPCRGAADPV